MIPSVPDRPYVFEQVDCTPDEKELGSSKDLET